RRCGRRMGLRTAVHRFAKDFEQVDPDAADRGDATAHGVSYGIVADYGGHGIGTAMHMDPFLPNVGRPGRGLRLVPGMALAIEPMLTAGSDKTEELDDGWTVVTLDGSRAAHWEHSVAVTDDGPLVLTVE
ncbi:MAG: M24 family metallopeptidase, partial [Actinomycetes bacterium]